MKYTAIVIALLMTILPARGQTTDWILPPQPGQITKNIHLVVDFSGSMNADQVSEAISQTLSIVSQSVDEVNIKVTVFGGTYTIWPGVENKSQPGWTALPDANAIKLLEEWLRTVSIDGDSTKLSEPLFVAATENIQKTIIIISDLFFDDAYCIRDVDLSKSTLGIIGIMNRNRNTLEFITNLLKQRNAFFCNIRRD